jgi:hypothetical protein
MNRQLHGERIFRGTHRRRFHQLPWVFLPAGTFVLLDETPALVMSDHLALWSRDGYQGRRSRPKSGTATVITPPATITVLQAGYPVQIDPAAWSGSRR